MNIWPPQKLQSYYSPQDESSSEGPFVLVGKANKSSNSFMGGLPAILTLDKRMDRGVYSHPTATE